MYARLHTTIALLCLLAACGGGDPEPAPQRCTAPTFVLVDGECRAPVM